MSNSRFTGARGIGLLELMFVLALLSSLVLALSYKTGDVFAKRKALDTAALLDMADKQLLQYVAEHGRLPCPDLDGDGLADAGAGGVCSGNQKGYLPYRTLGMTDANYIQGEVPMLYGVHRQGGIDFAGTGQVYVPSYADVDNAPQDVAVAQRNTFDFCAQLAQLRDQPYDPTGLRIEMRPAPLNAVYALAVPGLGDSDGAASLVLAGGARLNRQYDGVNAASAVAFAAPQQALSSAYDDRTLYRAAADLHDYYRCDTMNRSIDLLTQAVSLEQQVQDMAEGNVEDAEHNLAINQASTALAGWALLQAIAEVSGAAEILTASSALLATAAASCPIPPFVGCALIPVYTIAVSNAGTGQGLAIAAAATAGAALGLQLTSTLMYEDIKDRTSRPPADSVADATVGADKLADLQAAYIAGKAVAQTAYNATLVLPSASEAALNASQQAAAVAVTAKIDAIGDPALKAALSDRLNGKTASCAVPPCTGFTARQVPQLDGSGKVLLDSAGQPLMRTIHTQELVAGVVPGMQAYYQVLAQGDAGAGLDPASTDPAIVAARNQLASAATAGADPVAAKAEMTARTADYNSLLRAVAAFDSLHMADPGNANPATQAARATLRTALGDSAWDYTATSSLCGSGACGWMDNTTAGAGAPTRSALLNTYLDAYADYQVALSGQKVRDQADSKARAAWGQRNSYKAALCANLTPSVGFTGAASSGLKDPAAWDSSENLQATPPSGLACGSGGASPADIAAHGSRADADKNAQRAAEQARYCSIALASYDATLCALYGAPPATRSTVRGPRPVVDALIQKGITQ